MGKFFVALDFLVNLGAPFLVYQLVSGHMSETAALMLSSVPPILWSIGQLIWSRKLDALSLLVITGIALSLVATLLGGSPRLLLVRESLITGIFGLIFLGSLLFLQTFDVPPRQNDRHQTGDDPRSVRVPLVDSRFPFHLLPDDNRMGRRSTGRSNLEDHFGFYHADWAVPRGIADYQLHHLFGPVGLVNLVQQPAEESGRTVGRGRGRKNRPPMNTPES
jgi:hypothetical protein